MAHKVVPVKNPHDHHMKYHVIREEETVATYDTQKEAELAVQRIDGPLEEPEQKPESGA